MDAAPDELRTSASVIEPLGAVPADAPDLGPISPELALIDPDLARRARELLPEPREWSRPRALPAPPPAREEPIFTQPPAEPEIEPAPRRRWAQTLVLAALTFAVGAASGTIIAPRHASSPGATLEFRAAGPAAKSQAKQQAIDQRTTQPSRHARVVWASNALGVVTGVSSKRVTLVWHRPAGSRRVVVTRARGRARSHVVYRGRRTRYEDRSIRPCTTYRYTLVSYDRRGHRSTGVSSSVVTPGCT
jgi:hypothetical protein